MRRNFRFHFDIMLLLLVAAPLALHAQEQVSPGDKPDQQAGDKKDEPKKEEGTLLDKLSKELFKDLDDGGAKKPEKDDKLERVAHGMRDAGDKLNENKTGQDTRSVQEQVIRDLDDLINQLQNPPPPPQGQGGGGGGGGGSSRGGASGKGSQSQMQKLGGGQAQRQQGQGQQGKSQPLGAQGKQGAESSKSGGQDKKVAEGSEERSESERKAAEEAARKKKLEMDVWGHLPPHLRDQLLNTYGEKVLPKYQHLVKQFYEALSEQGDAGPRR